MYSIVLPNPASATKNIVTTKRTNCPPLCRIPALEAPCCDTAHNSDYNNFFKSLFTLACFYPDPILCYSHQRWRKERRINLPSIMVSSFNIGRSFCATCNLCITFMKSGVTIVQTVINLVGWFFGWQTLWRHGRTCWCCEHSHLMSMFALPLYDK